MKTLVIIAVILAPVLMSAQSGYDNLYTRASVFTKEVNSTAMYGIQGDAGFLIGKHMTFEMSTAYSNSLSNDVSISNMEAGLFLNATTNNEQDLIASLGFGVKGQSKFISSENDNIVDEKIDELDPTIKGLTQLKVSSNFYIHVGWELGLETKEEKYLIGIQFDF